MFIQYLLGKNKYAIFTVVLLLLSLFGGIYLVKQRQVRQRAAPGLITLKSELGQGAWKKVDFDAYRQGDDLPQFPGQCGGVSASKCHITAYDTSDGWINLDYDDSSWSAGYQVDSDWWQGQDWDCSRQFIQNGSQIINFKNPNEDGHFKNLNDKTGLYRRLFTIPDDFQIAAAKIKLFSDNKTLIYINGHLLPPKFSELCYEYDISISLLQKTQNILAIQLSNDAVSDFDNPMGLAYELTITGPDITSTPPISPPPSPTPSVPLGDAYCLYCHTYDQNWQQITNLDDLVIDENIYFAVMGFGQITKGRFRVTIDGTVGDWQESDQKNDNDEFYIPYTVHQAGTHHVKCEVYSPNSGWR